MTGESPLRAQPDSRILEQDSQQGYLFEDPESFQEQQLLADYRQRYGLSEDPFAHDYSFPLFTGAGRRQLLDQLLHLCQFSNSLLVVLGENSVGKTRIAHAFMDSLSDQDQICFLSLRSGQSLEQILVSINQAFGIQSGDVPSTENLLAALESFIAEEALVEDEGLALVVLDNAHLLDDQTISVLTALLNNFPQQNRLHLALFGEPALMHRLERLSPENLLCNDFYLQAFNLLETVDYLNFRMEMADYLGPEIFTEAKVDAWWRQAQGQLNVLHGLAEEHLLESVTPATAMNKRPLPVVHIIAISLLVTVVGVAFLYMGDDESDLKPVVAAQSSATGPQSASFTSSPVSSLELTSTQTPVQPLMQSLPPPESSVATQSHTVVGPEPASAAATNPAIEIQPRSEIVQEQVVPLAQLPTAPPKLATQPAAVSEPNVELPSQPVAKLQPVSSVAIIATSSAPSVAVKPNPPIAAEPIAAGKPATKVMERNLLNWKAGEYTIQLLGVSNQKAALDYIAAQPNKKELLMFKSKRAGKDWFVVVTGRFMSSAQARQAISKLPTAQRDAGPWPRDLKTIQAEIKAAM